MEVKGGDFRRDNAAAARSRTIGDQDPKHSMSLSSSNWL